MVPSDVFQLAVAIVSLCNMRPIHCWAEEFGCIEVGVLRTRSYNGPPNPGKKRGQEVNIVPYPLKWTLVNAENDLKTLILCPLKMAPRPGIPPTSSSCVASHFHLMLLLGVNYFFLSLS